MRSRQIAALACLVMLTFFGAESAQAQLNQLNAGGGGNAAAGGAGTTGTPLGGSTGQGTTEGPGGVTGQGPGAAVNQAVAGGNAAANFIGAQAIESFVGGGFQNQQNANRIFQAITGANVPAGGNQSSSGEPRRVAVSLRVAFAYPQPDASALSIEPSDASLTRIALFKPELQSVAVNVDSAGTARLTGTAPDAAASRLAANLVRLRPGIRSVVNQIQVGGVIPLQPPIPY